MASKALPSPEVLRQLLRYEPDTGKLFWLQRGPEWFEKTGHPAEHEAARWNSRYAGREALSCICSRFGYKHGAILGQSNFRAHRVVWAIYYGSWAINAIDHKNAIRTDNRIVNLRAASTGENVRNTSKRAGRSSEFIGVSFHKGTQKWRARIAIDGKTIALGYFFNQIEAAICRDHAATIHHGEFARLNFSPSP